MRTQKTLRVTNPNNPMCETLAEPAATACAEEYSQGDTLCE